MNIKDEYYLALCFLFLCSLQRVCLQCDQQGYSWMQVFISFMLQTCTNLTSPWSCNTLNPRPWNCRGLGFPTLRTSTWISSELFTRATRAKKTSAHSKLQRETLRPGQWSMISNLAQGMKISEDYVWFGYAYILIFRLSWLVFSALCWRFGSSEVWRFLLGCIVLDVSKDLVPLFSGSSSPRVPEEGTKCLLWRSRWWGWPN